MSSALIVAIIGVAALGGLASYLIAYYQLTRRVAPVEARRRALAAVPGPVASTPSSAWSCASPCRW
jgi:hypothetical protein